MPLVRLEFIKGKNTEYKSILMQSIHDALMDVLHIEDDDRFQRLYELNENFYERGASQNG